MRLATLPSYRPFLRPAACGLRALPCLSCLSCLPCLSRVHTLLTVQSTGPNWCPQLFGVGTVCTRMQPKRALGGWERWVWNRSQEKTTTKDCSKRKGGADAMQHDACWSTQYSTVLYSTLHVLCLYRYRCAVLCSALLCSSMYSPRGLSTYCRVLYLLCPEQLCISSPLFSLAGRAVYFILFLGIRSKP